MMRDPQEISQLRLIYWHRPGQLHPDGLGSRAEA